MISPEKWDAPKFYNCQFCAHSIYILAKTLDWKVKVKYGSFFCFFPSHTPCVIHRQYSEIHIKTLCFETELIHEASRMSVFKKILAKTLHTIYLQFENASLLKQFMKYLADNNRDFEYFILNLSPKVG